MSRQTNRRRRNTWSDCHVPTQCLLPLISGSPASWLTGSITWGWGASHPVPEPSALVPTRIVSSHTALLPVHQWLHLRGPFSETPKYADYTTVIGLIQDGDKSTYRQEVQQLVQWWYQNHLELNPFKTVEMIVDFKRSSPLPSPAVSTSRNLKFIIHKMVLMGWPVPTGLVLRFWDAVCWLHPWCAEGRLCCWRVNKKRW